MANYPNLPGVSVEVKDGQMSLTPGAAGQRVLLIGEVPSTVDAPDEPTLVRSSDEMEKLFGGFMVGGVANPIAIEWQSIMKEAKIRVYLLALKGADEKEKFVNLQEALTTYISDSEFEHVVLTGMYANQKVEGITADDFKDEEIKAAFPDIMGVEKEGADTYVGSPALLIAGYAERQSAQSNDTIAYIGVKPIADTSMKTISTYAKDLAALDNQYSKYLQVVAGPAVGVAIENSTKLQWATGVGAYAALVSKLDPQDAPTNQKFSSITSLRYLFSQKQLNALVGDKYVTYTIKKNNVIVVDGVTSAPDITIGNEVRKSDFTRLSTLRATNYMVQAVRNACDPFIGEPAELPLYTSLTAAIKSEISGAIQAGIIQDARFSISMFDSFDSAVVNLTILPQFELRTIKISIGLNDPIAYSVNSETTNP